MHLRAYNVSAINRIKEYGWSADLILQEPLLLLHACYKCINAIEIGRGLDFVVEVVLHTSLDVVGGSRCECHDRQCGSIRLCPTERSLNAQGRV